MTIGKKFHHLGCRLSTIGTDLAAARLRYLARDREAAGRFNSR